MKDLTIIIPVNEFNQIVEEYLEKSVKSCEAAGTDATKVFVGPKEVLDNLKKTTNYTDWKYVYNEKSDFPAQINAAVKECKTKYFSILEYDDEYTDKWFNNVQTYINCGDKKYEEYEGISLYLPLTEIIDYNEVENGPIGYVNEAVWASSFSDNIGFIDLECLKNYMNFNTTGGVFNTEDFIKLGGLKESMKLTFWYEYLLRSVYKGKKVFVIPKVGYRHLINRPSSLSTIYNAEMDSKEADWWIELAQKEYLFTNDRKKTYEE